MRKPRIAIIPGDPSGIGPELIIKLINLPNITEYCNALLVGDTHLWQLGAQQAEKSFLLDKITEDEIVNQKGLSHLDLNTIQPEQIKISEVTTSGGQTSLRCLDKALDLAMNDLVDGILFAPFNKAAMSLAGLNAEDEHVYMARYLGFDGYHSEINVLNDMMTTRVTSHISLKEVAKNITEKNILNAIKLANDTLLRSGNKNPQIAVAALNPHAGDNGKFGREEIEIIQPAIKEAQSTKINALGPYPSDTVFLKAIRGDVDAVVTMYHDQGQIAVKLLGFESGVTVAGGLPIPVTTPAHGTAFDIAGQNKAEVGATHQAFKLLIRLATNHLQSKVTK